ncbi:putative beta-1,6-glucan boisynthesis protein (Knh1) [Diplocarpon rosae]|nr:putative beta-1,6-glucan boisynthesis protein (Knh1) [Diplocarpon rosae]
MRLAHALILLAPALPWVSADVKFTVPAAGASIAGGAAFTVAWEDSGEAPALADLTSYTLFLFSGSNNVPAQLLSLKDATFAAGSTVSVTVPVGSGGTGTNMYFLGMLSVAAAGGTVWNYSNRFTLTGMTGVFDPVVAANNKLVVGTTGPDTQNNVVADAAASGQGDFEIPYTMQTGLTKYAPMQPVPPTAITATNTAPLWPTSAVQFAVTFLPTPSQVTTFTQSQTFSISSRANTAAAAPMPTDDMQKFLNRWKD